VLAVNFREIPEGTVVVSKAANTQKVDDVC